MSEGGLIKGVGKVKMLFLNDNNFIDVVREPQFPGLVTVCASSPLALAPYRRYSEGAIVRNTDPGATLPYMVHITLANALQLIGTESHNLEFVEENISPAAVAYCFSGYEKEGGNQSWGYCWPDEIEDVRSALDDLEDIVFYPLFEVPSDLPAK
jgi:hypothetical protein